MNYDSTLPVLLQNLFFAQVSMTLLMRAYNFTIFQWHCCMALRVDDSCLFHDVSWIRFIDHWMCMVWSQKFKSVIFVCKSETAEWAYQTSETNATARNCTALEFLEIARWQRKDLITSGSDSIVCRKYNLTTSAVSTTTYVRLPSKSRHTTRLIHWGNVHCDWGQPITSGKYSTIQ